MLVRGLFVGVRDSSYPKKGTKEIVSQYELKVLDETIDGIVLLSVPSMEWIPAGLVKQRSIIEAEIGSFRGTPFNNSAEFRPLSVKVVEAASNGSSSVTAPNPPAARAAAAASKS